MGSEHLPRALLSSLIGASLIGTSLFGAVGCIEIADFDPAGPGASISASWTIDGAPPTEESCERLGAERVQVTFLDLMRPVPHPDLFFECQLGQFDTLDGTGAVVAEGQWSIRLDAIGSGGDIVAIGAVEQAVVPDVPAIALAPVDFSSSNIVAHYLIDGEAPREDACLLAGIAEVGLSFDGALEEARVGCQRQLVGRIVPANGTYSVHLVTYDAEGAVLGMSAVETFTVAVGDECFLGGRCLARCSDDDDCGGAETCQDDRCRGPDEAMPAVELPR